MTNKKLLEKLREDMEMRGFSHYTKYSYYHKAKEIIEFLMKYLREKRKLPKILSEKGLNVFFNACENYIYKTIFMLIYGSGLRI